MDHTYIPSVVYILRHHIYVLCIYIISLVLYHARTNSIFNISKYLTYLLCFSSLNQWYNIYNDTPRVTMRVTMRATTIYKFHSLDHSISSLNFHDPDNVHNSIGISSGQFGVWSFILPTNSGDGRSNDPSNDWRVSRVVVSPSAAPPSPLKTM